MVSNESKPVKDCFSTKEMSKTYSSSQTTRSLALCTHLEYGHFFVFHTALVNRQYEYAPVCATGRQ